MKTSAVALLCETAAGAEVPLPSIFPQPLHTDPVQDLRQRLLSALRKKVLELRRSTAGNGSGDGADIANGGGHPGGREAAGCKEGRGYERGTRRGTKAHSTTIV